MRVPAPVTNQVVTDSKELAYLQTPPGVGAGLEALGNSLGRLGAIFEQRQDKTNRFNAQIAYSQFQTDAATTQTELKRNASPDGKDFAKQAQTIFDKNAETFITNNIPENLRDEFRARLAQEKQGIMSDAYKFQYEAGDAWFKEGVSKEYNKSLGNVTKSPDSLDAETKRIGEIIDATDLPEVEKHQLKENMNIGLLGAQYYQKVKTAHEAALETQSANITDGIEGAKSLLRGTGAKDGGYEGFSPVPYWDVNAWRIGFGSDTYQKDGKTHVVTKDTPAITREQAEQDIEYRLQHREGAQVREQLGDTWGQLSPQTQAALLSVGYNYGSLPTSVVTAAKSGDMDKLATAVESLSSNKSRRRNEASIIRNQTNIKADSRYDAIPYDDRIKIEAQAESEAKKDFTAQQKQQQLEDQERVNSLMTSIYDGKAGPIQIQKARDEGWLTKITDIVKADELYKKASEETNLALQASERLKLGGPWDYTDSDVKKQANALMAQDNGLDKLGQKDENFLQNTVLPFISQTGMVAPNIRGTLLGMYSTSRNGMDAFALDAMSRIKAVNPEAYLQGFPDDVRKQVDAWDTLRSTFKDAREAIGWIKGGNDPQQRRAQLELAKEGKDFLSQSKDRVSNLQKNVGSLISSFDQSWFGANPAPLNAVVEQSLSNEYNDEFVKAYRLYGDPDKADEAAQKAIKENWGVSPTDSTIMKYPPQNMGYKPSPDGSYKWIPDSIREELKLPANTQIHFLSDEETKQDYTKWVADPEHNQPPAYHVYITDENGVTKALTDKDGVPLPPMWFKKPENIKKFEEVLFDWSDSRAKLQNRLNEIEQMMMNLSTLNRFSGEKQRELPEELKQEREQLQNNLKQLDRENPANANDTYEMPPTDIMGNPY